MESYRAKEQGKGVTTSWDQMETLVTMALRSCPSSCPELASSLLLHPWLWSIDHELHRIHLPQSDLGPPATKLLGQGHIANSFSLSAPMAVFLTPCNMAFWWALLGHQV